MGPIKIKQILWKVKSALLTQILLKLLSCHAHHASLALCLPCLLCCTNVSRTKYCDILKYKVLANPNIAGVGDWVSVAGKGPPAQSSIAPACSQFGGNSLLGFCPLRTSLGRWTKPQSLLWTLHCGFPLCSVCTSLRVTKPLGSFALWRDPVLPLRMKGSNGVTPLLTFIHVRGAWSLFSGFDLLGISREMLIPWWA